MIATPHAPRLERLPPQGERSEANQFQQARLHSANKVSGKRPQLFAGPCAARRPCRISQPGRTAPTAPLVNRGPSLLSIRGNGKPASTKAGYTEHPLSENDAPEYIRYMQALRLL